MNSKQENKKVVILPEFNELREETKELQSELAGLIYERDEMVFHQSKNLNMVYMNKVGNWEYKAYEFKMQALRIKRKIELVQQRINLQQKVITAEIEEQLDQEYAEYQKELEERLAKVNSALQRAKDASISDADSDEIKKIYRKIVKQLHPDLCADMTPERLKLFYEAVEAYEAGDLETLRSIEIVIEKISDSDADDEGTMTALRNKKKRLESQIAKVKENINEIKSSYPFDQIEFLADDAAVEKRIKECKEEIACYKRSFADLEKRLAKMLEV